MKEDVDLVIPVYLDVQALLDVLASIEDGFKLVETHTTRINNSKNTEISGDVGLGIKNILSIFKVNLEASGSTGKGKENEETRQGERYHTYGSLMNRLRKNLVDNGLIKKINDEDSWENIGGSDFVEIHGKFIPNPLITQLKTFTKLLDIAESASDLPPDENLVANLPKDQKRKKLREIKKNNEKELKKSLGFKKFIGDILKDMENENLKTYIIETESVNNYKVVTDLFTEYIRDPSGIELMYGEFKVLGKVVKKIDNNDSIDLLRGSVIGLNEDFILQIMNSFEALKAEGFNKLPKTFTKVKAPAIQIIPIAIYL